MIKYSRSKVKSYSSVEADKKLGILVRSCSSHNHQNIHEELGDVKIEIESSKNVLFRTERIFVLASQHQLSVINDVKREHQSPCCSEPNHCVLGCWDEDHDNATDHEDDEKCQEESSTCCKVNFRLKSKQGETQSDGSSTSNSNQNGINVIKGRRGSKHDTPASCKKSQEDEVVGRFSSDFSTTSEDECDDKSKSPTCPHHPSVVAHISFQILNE